MNAWSRLNNLAKNAKNDQTLLHYSLRTYLKKTGKMSDIELLSNYPLPPCPKNDNCKNDKSQHPMGPSLLEERMTNSRLAQSGSLKFHAVQGFISI